MNHHLPFLAPGVKKEICRKQGVEYKVSDGYRDAFAKHLEHMKELSLPQSPHHGQQQTNTFV